MDQTTVVIQAVETKPTANGGVLYRAKCSDNRTYSTFDAVTGAGLVALMGQMADINYDTKQTTKGDQTYTNYNVAQVRASTGQASATAPLPTSSQPAPVAQAPSVASYTGEPDWDLIGLRKTRCALWVAYFSGGMPQTVVEDTIARGKLLVDAAEAHIYRSGAADGLGDDVPFQATI